MLGLNTYPKPLAKNHLGLLGITS